MTEKGQTAMSTDEEFEAELGAVFDDLINLIGETKQAAWTASSSERRQAFDNLKSYLAEQAVAIDDAERRIGTRPPWVRSPTAHRARNIAGEAAGDSDRLVELLVRDLRLAVEDIRRRAATITGEGQQLLVDVADDLERHTNAL